MVENAEKAKKVLGRTAKRKIFYALAIALPLLQFAVFYLYANFNVIIMAFKSYTYKTVGVGYDVSFAGIENFKTIFRMLGTDVNYKMIINSVLLMFLRLVLGTTISLLFSYYVYKKSYGSGFFKVILFLPNIISGLVMVLLFRYIAEDVYKAVFKVELGLLSNINTRLVTVIVYNLFLGFAAQILMYSSAMSGIDESIVESSKIDGATPVKEFFHITIPSIYPTIVSFIIMGIATCFTDQMALFTFYYYNADPSIQTVGYYLYIQSLDSDIIPKSPWNPLIRNSRISYSQISAFGFMIAVVMIPFTFLVKHLMEKWGPSVE